MKKLKRINRSDRNNASPKTLASYYNNQLSAMMNLKHLAAAVDRNKMLERMNSAFSTYWSNYTEPKKKNSKVITLD